MPQSYVAWMRLPSAPGVTSRSMPPTALPASTRGFSSSHSPISSPPATSACSYIQEKAAFIFCVEDRALFCPDCDQQIHSPGSLSANHQRFLATGICVALSSDNPSKVVAENRLGPPPPSQKAQQVPKTEVSISASHWGVDELLQLSDFDSSDKKEQIEFGELDWLADMGIFTDQLPQEALAPTEVPQLPASQHLNNHTSSRITSKLGVTTKKPRIELLVDEDEAEHLTVPDLG
ncbi:hypothetical protein MLD38_018753 [Melastoma candidum]|uniref:Uncharacterized protein n=1 Tax=Melastoma candidum TaxID=119954 RepID=A0ACB9QYU8_9MYRT|nr:hypothetical protein MLD38_018753 [Melastoma candidum]